MSNNNYRLSSVCKIQYGFAFDSKKFSPQKGMPLIRIRDVKRGYTETYTSENYGAEYLVCYGDLLIGMDGEFNIGRWLSDPALLNQRVCRLIPDESKCNLSYILHCMPKKLKEIEDETPYVTVKHLSAKKLNELQIPLPPLAEQQKIAHELDKISDLIAKRKSQIEKLDLLAKAKFVEMFGDGQYEKKKLAEVCLKITDGTHQSPEFLNEGIPFLLVSNIVNNKIKYETKKFISQNDYEVLIKRTPIQIGDILLTTVGSYGNPAIVEETRPFCFQRHIGYIKPKLDEINSYFLKHIFLSPEGVQQIEERVKGVAQKTLNLSELKSMEIIVPPIQLQTQFANYVQDVEKTKTKMEQGLAELEVLYQARMQKYFGGE